MTWLRTSYIYRLVLVARLEIRLVVLGCTGRLCWSDRSLA